MHIQDASYELPAPIFRSTHIECRHGALRRMLIQKPHGDPSQCVNLVVPPANPAADAGLIIMGTMGYPDFSGSNAMCTMAAMFGTGRLSMGEGERRVVVEGWGEVSFSLVYGGVFYALITGVDIGLEAVNCTAL
ncbi:proline racemase family protein [Marinobacter lipolyticus]|uniref:proline racemase family protein n=1 Tax=Marinobacter lipolyticus TaxID=209639 RepID=UPI003A8CD168